MITMQTNHFVNRTVLKLFTIFSGTKIVTADPDEVIYVQSITQKVIHIELFICCCR
jgi:hypothetical protein